METPVNIASDRPYRRAKVLVNPNFQWKMVAWGLASIATIVFLIFISDFILFSQLKNVGYESGFSAEHSYFQIFSEFQHRRQLMLLVLSFSLFTLHVGFYVIYSHRIAGPIYGSIKYLNEMSSGKKPGPLKFRKKDFFPELADAINRVADKNR